jgi:hypothetical protein
MIASPPPRSFSIQIANQSVTGEWGNMINALRRAAAALVVVSGVALGATSAAAASAPFYASYAGTATWTSPTTIALAGTGTATHLGRLTNTGTVYLLNFDSACPDGPDGVASVNVETLTAADGSALHITSDDVACPTGPGVYQGTGHWTVTGGTGRFSGATGGGPFHGTADLNQGLFTSNPTGTLVLSHG